MKLAPEPAHEPKPELEPEPEPTRETRSKVTSPLELCKRTFKWNCERRKNIQMMINLKDILVSSPIFLVKDLFKVDQVENEKIIKFINN